MMPTLSSLVTLEVVIRTTSSAARDDKVGIMTILWFLYTGGFHMHSDKLHHISIKPIWSTWPPWPLPVPWLLRTWQHQVYTRLCMNTQGSHMGVASMLKGSHAMCWFAVGLWHVAMYITSGGHVYYNCCLSLYFHNYGFIVLSKVIK